MPRPDTALPCRRARVLLEAYLDGDLHGARRAQMDAHLAGCHSCAQELLRARQVRGALRDLPPQSCGDAVMATVQARLAAAGDAAAVPGASESPEVRRSPEGAASPVRGGRPAPAGWRERLLGLWGGHAPGWRPAMMFGSVAAVALVGFLLLHRPQHEQTVTAEDMRRADAQVRWVLARLGQINDRTAERVRTEAFDKGIAQPTMRAVNGALENSVRQ